MASAAGRAQRPLIVNLSIELALAMIATLVWGVLLPVQVAATLA